MNRRIYVDKGELLALRLFFRDFGIWNLIGSHSITVPSLQTKIVLRSACAPWADLEGQTYLMTPGEAARIELQRAFPGLKRVGWLGKHAALFSKQVPLYFTGPVKGELYYVDLMGAYHQIYSAVWLDVRYPCGRGVHSLAGVGAALADWKQARNSVIGVCRSRAATGVKGARTYVLATTNKFLSPELWATVAGVLQCLAAIAARTGNARYINTDGYIFDKYDNFQFFTSLLRRWGFRFKTEQGEGEIEGWGRYRVGNKRAGRAGAPGLAVSPISTLETPFPGLLDWWLRQKERLEREHEQTDSSSAGE